MHLSSRRFARFAAFAALLAGLMIVPSAVASQSLGSRVLREGMSGSDVTALQQLLTKAGFSTAVNGNFGPATKTEVISFERKYHLKKANGAVTKADATQLRHVVALTQPTFAPSGGVAFGEPASPSSPLYGPTLRMGSRGRFVSLLQSDLTFAGYTTPVSGYFGSATLQSANSFKSANGLALNGWFGKKAWNVLRAAVQAVESSAPTEKARLNPDGQVTAPSNAPTIVKEVIAAANQIATKPYCYGGGHGTWTDSCYDCSGSVSYALHGGGLLSVTEDSGEMESYGSPGYGRWITIYANAGHAYMKVAGMWFDTAAQSSSNGNNRWSTTRISPAGGFVVRHPTGL